MKSLKLITTLTIALTLLSCTSFRSYQKAQEFELLKDWDKAVLEYTKALEVDPGNTRYKISLDRAKREASRVHFEKGKELRAAGHNQLAMAEYELVVRLDPTNQYAAVEYGKAVAAYQEATRSLDRDSVDNVKRRANTSKPQPPTLNPASDEPITLSFPRETPVKDIYRSLGGAFGINILFDPEVKDDRISIELRDVTAQAALERLMNAAGHFYKVLDEKTIMVIPDNPQTRRNYEDLVIRTFYLSNGDAEQVVNVVRTMTEARNVYPLKALNAITIRDTADRVRIAEKIIEANDKARAEVVVSVELLELNLVKARDLGLQLLGTSGQVNLLDGAGKPLTGGTLPVLREALNGGADNLAFNIPAISYGFIKSGSNAKLLAQPQLRISEGEKATLHIGQRIPVAVSTFTSSNPGGGGTFTPVTSFNYLDIGIKISIEPRVHHNREVSLKLQVEVSSQAGEVNAGNGNPPQPIIATRTIESTIRLKDGETNFLAGLIRKDESNGTNTTPFLGDLPLIGRLFSRDTTRTNDTDLVLTMTPHIVRIPDITEDDVAPMWVGTINNLTFRGVSPRVETNNTGDPFVRNPSLDQFNSNQEGEVRVIEVPAVPNEQAPAQRQGPAPAQGTAPTDIFRQQPNPNAPRPPQTPQPNELSRPGTGGDVAAARLSPQPSRLALKAGQESVWPLVGMELEGLRTNDLTLRYDPRSMQVVTVGFGEALEVNPATPPVANIDPVSGTIRVTSTDGKPLSFRAGGNVLILRVRGGVSGESMLVLDPPSFLNRSGVAVQAIVTGGRANVE